MATNTYVALDKVTVGTAVSSVTFSSINQGYTDLVIVINGNAVSDNGTGVEFNGDTGTNYSTTVLYGDGSAAGSARASNATKLDLGRVNGSNSTSIIQVMNYSNTTTYKTTIGRGNTNGLTIAGVGLWRSTAAINAVKIYANSVGSSQNFAVGTTLSLYGIAAASVGAKATGGTISSDSQYYYHTFTSTGPFTPLQSLTCDYLVVAGGGGGFQGGGGAGGLRSTVGATGGGGSLETPLSVTATAYTITVGAGGAAQSSGNNSVFSTITATAGGRGGKFDNSVTAATGGSGGGGGGSDSTGYSGAAGTTNQGYTGGNGFAQSGVGPAGGGGGANSAGTNGTTSVAGNGGTGVTTAISGYSTTYAGGGGGGVYGSGTTGGTGGSSIGGNGGSGASPGTNAGSGLANTGSGGGGAGFGTSGAGGSGIVIIRYAK